MRVTQRMLVDNVRLNISTNAENLAALQDQVSSGMRIRRPSDDPQAVSRALTLRATSDRNAQYLRNVASARGWLEATDIALNQLSDVLMRARDVVLRSRSDSLSSDERRGLSEQIGGLLDEVLQAANGTHEGKYLFSGHRVTTLPFDATRDPSSNRVTDVSYRGDSKDLGRDIGGDTVMAVNVPGSATVQGREVMLRVMSTLVEVRDQLGSGAGLVAAAQVDEISASLDGVATLRGSVGARMSHLDATDRRLSDVQNSLAATLSRVQDADIAEVITDLMRQETVYRASLSIGARVIQPSLLDFLR